MDQSQLCLALHSPDAEHGKRIDAAARTMGITDRAGVLTIASQGATKWDDPYEWGRCRDVLVKQARERLGKNDALWLVVDCPAMARLTDTADLLTVDWKVYARLTAELDGLYTMAESLYLSGARTNAGSNIPPIGVGKLPENGARDIHRFEFQYGNLNRWWRDNLTAATPTYTLYGSMGYTPRQCAHLIARSVGIVRLVDLPWYPVIQLDPIGHDEAISVDEWEPVVRQLDAVRDDIERVVLYTDAPNHPEMVNGSLSNFLRALDRT